MAQKFSDEVIKEYEEIAARYPVRQASLLPALWLAQREFGYISEETLHYIASLVGVAPIKVQEVADFYTMYQRQQPGRFHLQICQTISCFLNGSEELKKFVEESLGLKPGETTPDGIFSYQPVECLGACHTAPMVQINDDYHEKVSVDGFGKLINELKEQGGR